jgi:hypothetical protein
MPKRNAPLWVGFLDAGKRSSPVVRDPNLDTGNRQTIYLYNHSRGRILEYRKDIVEIKLRELTPDEQTMARELRDSFLKAQTDFTPRGSGRIESSRVRRPPKQPQPEIEDFDDDTDWPMIGDAEPDSEAAELEY